eukprot:1696299-Prymnesium_polylepis.1
MEGAIESVGRRHDRAEQEAGLLIELHKGPRLRAAFSSTLTALGADESLCAERCRKGAGGGETAVPSMCMWRLRSVDGCVVRRCCPALRVSVSCGVRARPTHSTAHTRVSHVSHVDCGCGVCSGLPLRCPRAARCARAQCASRPPAPLTPQLTALSARSPDETLLHAKTPGPRQAGGRTSHS